jgi:hypothetical protein
MLTLSGLTAENYELLIDGKSVGKFSRTDLEQGVNLALFDTPMVQQSLEVQKLTNHHSDLFRVRWHQIQMAFAGEPSLDKALKALETLEQDVVKKQRATAKPVVHTYVLKVS